MTLLTSTCCCRTVWCFDFSTKIPTHLFSNSCWYHQEFCFDKAFDNLYLNFITISLDKLKFYIPSIKFQFQKAWCNGIFIWCIFIVIYKDKIVVFYGQMFLLFIRKSAKVFLNLHLNWSTFTIYGKYIIVKHMAIDFVFCAIIIISTKSHPHDCLTEKYWEPNLHSHFKSYQVESLIDRHWCTT